MVWWFGVVCREREYPQISLMQLVNVTCNLHILRAQRCTRQTIYRETYHAALETKHNTNNIIYNLYIHSPFLAPLCAWVVLMDLLLQLLCILPLLYSLFGLFKLILQRRGQSCYMLAYECFKPPEDMKIDTDSCARIVLRNKNLGLEEYRFLLKTIVSSGIGEHTYCPRNVLEGREECPSLKDTHAEIDEIMFTTLDNLFKRTGFSPSEIDILVVNVSLFSPAPSLTARIINRYCAGHEVGKMGDRLGFIFRVTPIFFYYICILLHLLIEVFLN